MDERDRIVEENKVIVNDGSGDREVILNVPKLDSDVDRVETMPEVILEKNDSIVDEDENIKKSVKVKTKSKSKSKSKTKSKEELLAKLDILKKLASGTGLREGLDNIVSGGMGALILIADQTNSSVFQGGFKINCKFTSKRFMELAKMDGAIILSEDYKKILFANTLLTPNKIITTRETGTRHQAAERTAKQTEGIVIAVSQRVGKITIYFGKSKYVLQNTEDLLRRATETIQILEKQKEVFVELINNLNLLEINNMVSVADVCALLERLEMIRKMTNIINEYIIELGRDGIILRMRMRELTKGIEKTQDLILKDYFSKPRKVRIYFDLLSFDGLIDLENISKDLFSKSLDTGVISKGYRILNKTYLPKEKIEAVIKHFKNLEGVYGASKESLGRTLKENPEILIKELSNIREHILIGKSI
ncbi:DNA integrity scanning protein DisA [Candidatus Pacearchaeota archaeon]|nr:DNA integrity scanning protein DisA [Candidatus Pacearchaeota archaeon]